MNTRILLDMIKERAGIRTDKQLAEEMGIKYGALTNWIARNSFQYEPIIIFLLKKGIDLNKIFHPVLLPDIELIILGDHHHAVGSVLPRMIKSSLEEQLEFDATQVAGEVEEAYIYLGKHGNLTMLSKFKETVTGIMALYKSKVDEMQEFMKK